MARLDRAPGVRARAAIVSLLCVGALACGPQGGMSSESTPDPASTAKPFPESRYLNLLKLSLLDLVYERGDLRRALRIEGRDFPGRAMTMIGQKRLDNLHFVIEDVLANDVPGDLLEAGAWRGGATIFMRGVLAERGVTDRTVWVADSFEGLPPPDLEQYPEDKASKFHENEVLAVSLESVQENFRRYDLLDGQVKFLKGWFKDTLPDAPIEQLAVLRLDADMYQSTTEGLEYLYPKLSPGGYVILDDYVCIEQCKRATEDFRKKYGIEAPVQEIDTCGVFWQKPR